MLKFPLPTGHSAASEHRINDVDNCGWACCGSFRVTWDEGSSSRKGSSGASRSVKVRVVL